MKRLCILVLLIIACSKKNLGQNIWTQKANVGGIASNGAIGFSIGSKGYLCTANTNDFWEYDPSSNVWTQKSNFIGITRSDAVGFSIGGKGYIATGTDAGTGMPLNDLWEYDPSTNAWTQKASFGGTARSSAVGFSIGTKGYIGTGGFTNDFWEYNPATNTWTQKASFGGSGRSTAVGFSIGTKGYIGSGSDGPASYKNDFWEYDPSSNTWTQKANFGGTARFSAIGFSIGGLGYIGAGGPNIAGYNDFWEYDPALNTWTKKADVGGGGRINGIGFSIGNKGYAGTGFNGTTVNDFWEYSNSTASWIGIYANDLNHNISPAFQLLESNNTNVSFPSSVNICADGSNVTVVKYLNNNSSIPNSSIKFRIQSDPFSSDINLNGKFYTSDYSYNGDTIIARYTHPTYVIPVFFNLFRSDNIEIVSGSNILYSYPIKIYRAPIVFVHGLWGNSTTFEAMQEQFLNSGLYPISLNNPNIHESPLLYKIDYAWTNASSYFTNRGQVKFVIIQVLRQARKEKYSAGKSIIICHSMGGILSRLYLQSTWSDAPYKNDMLKLITLNTPHYGTQVANRLWDSQHFLISPLNSVMCSPNNNGDINAIQDLKVNSDAILNRLNINPSSQIKIASTTMHTDASGDYSTLADLVRGWVFLNQQSHVNTLFNNETNDLIVPNSSQSSDLNLYSTVSGQWHVGSPSNTTLINSCINLLDANPVTSSLFTSNGFPIDILPPPQLTIQPVNNFLKVSSIDSIKIISPLGGQSFNQGDVVTIDLFSSGSFSRMGLLVYGNSINPISIDTPLVVSSFHFQIPSTANGNLNILIAAGDSLSWLANDTIHIIVNSNSIPDSIIVKPNIVNLPIGLTHSVNALGYFNGVPVNLIGSPNLFVAFDTTIVHQIAPGIFQGILADSINVIFNYFGRIDTVCFQIYDDPTALTASFNFASNNICSNSSVQFTDASLGIPVGYQWTFQGGTPSGSIQPNPLVNYSSSGIYQVKLKTFFTNGVDSVTFDSLILVNALPSPVILGNTLICQGDSTILGVDSGYVNYLWSTNDTAPTIKISTSGNYSVIVTDSNGCINSASTIIMNNSADTAVNVNGFALTASASVSTYQWIYCDSVPISGQINQSFLALQNGFYAVIVSQNGCIDTSNCYSIMGVGTAQINDTYNNLIYPNPTNGLINIEISGLPNTSYILILTNTFGQLLRKKEVKAETIFEQANLDIHDLSKGVYILYIESEKEKKVYKVLKN